jgi:hypothetical protein
MNSASPYALSDSLYQNKSSSVSSPHTAFRDPKFNNNSSKDKDPDSRADHSHNHHHKTKSTPRRIRRRY